MKWFKLINVETFINYSNWVWKTNGSLFVRNRYLKPVESENFFINKTTCEKEAVVLFICMTNDTKVYLMAAKDEANYMT